jgi:uncharacterized membrane protein YccC
MGTTDIMVAAMVVLFSVSFLFMLSQIGMNEINPSSSVFYDCDNGLLSPALIGGNCTNIGNYNLSNNISGRFASQSVTISQTTGDVFTDTFTAAKNWLFDKMGVGWVLGILTAPYSILITMGASAAVAAGFSAIFYLTMLFLFVSWVMGR